MNILIHRGTHEIGGTCIELRSQQARIVLDIGLPLVDEVGEEFEGNPKDVLPLVIGLFGDSGDRPDALLLSHAHQDHYGLLSFVDADVPVYASEGTKRLIGIGNLFSNARIDTDKIQSIPAFKPFSIKDFKLTPYLVDHSAFDALAWLIEANGKSVFYSGDIRATGRKGKLFDHLLGKGPKGMDALLLEGTTVDRKKPEYETENDVEQALIHECKANSGIVLVFTSAQNIDRVVSMYRAAKQSGRILSVDVYAAHVLDVIGDLAIIPQADWDRIKVYYPYWLTKRLINEGNEKIPYKFTKEKVTKEQMSANPEKYLVLTRPTMMSDLKMLNLQDAAAIWSMWGGYLKSEKSKQFLEFLKQHGLNLKHIHVGGHAPVQDLKRLASALAPKTLIPIHTFNPEKFHEIYDSVTLLQDGVAHRI